jgi:hypothetical protein
MEIRQQSDGISFRGIKLLLMFFLSVFILAEGYYICRLQDRIVKRSNELKNISVQLQHLKKEREDLKIELSSVKKTGDTSHGNTAER